MTGSSPVICRRRSIPILSGSGCTIAITEIASTTTAADTVVVFAHGGVVNVTLQDILGLARPLSFPIDYCSITRILFSRTGRRTAATVNENGHIWELLPRNISS